MTQRTASPCVLALAVASLLARALAAQPVAAVHEVVDEYHGTRITDPYRYLEDLTDPTVKAWMTGQDEHARATLARLPGRAALLRRMEELDASSTTEVSSLTRLPGGRLFYLKRSAGEEATRLYVRDGLTGRETLLLDPGALQRSTGHPHAVDYLAPSPDGRYVAYGISEKGTERSVLTILEVATRRAVDAPIDRAQFANPSWSDDGKTLFYNRLRRLPPDAPEEEGYKGSSVFAHAVGTSPEEDRIVFDGTLPGVAIDRSDIPYLIVIPGTGQVVAIAAPGGIAPGFAAFAAELSRLDGRRTAWRKLFGKEDQVSRFDVHGDDLYLVTWKGTPRHRVIRTSLAHPDLTRAQELVPASDATLGDIVASREAIYVEASAGSTGKILRVPYGASKRPEELKLPLAGTVVLVGGHPLVDGVLVAIAGWTRAPAIYGYDPRAGKLTDTGLRPSGRFGRPSNLVSEEVEVRSHDGTLVPLSIVHRRGLKLDGRNPTLLQGYGAYGFSTSPNFAPWDLAFYERGGVLAYAHVRGGGEHGEAWHLAGYQKTKPNTWKDFIACAEYLIAKGYTSPEQLAGIGTSAGGILIGRAITERPDLFAAAIVRVGVLDMLRFEETENGAPNVEEFGSKQTEKGFRALLEMSAYHHVRPGVSYPAVLLAHGLNDARVPVWTSTKMAARLAAATASGRPVLLRLDAETGHGQGATASHRREERADIFAFVLWQCGGRGRTPGAGR